LNSDINKWGHFFYKEKNDVLRVDVPVSEPKKMTEALSMDFSKEKFGCTLFIAWENSQISLPIQIEFQR
ncbi:MAG: DUF2911 domain-containing protein, partial [Bacteroidia bacterium]